MCVKCREGVVAETKRPKVAVTEPWAKDTFAKLHHPITTSVSSSTTIRKSSKPKCSRSSTRNKTSQRGPAERGWSRTPNAPKRPNSTFLLFANEEREKVIAQNPDVSFGDIGLILVFQWH